MESADVVVIGGSVSGSPTAMLLARRGLKVVLVEKKVFPRDTLSTHFLWARGVSYLNRWGLAKPLLERTPHFSDLEINIEGISLKGSIPLADLEERFLHLHGDGRGVVNTCCGPRRYLLDQLLLDAAKSAGVDVREGVSFTGPLMENGAVVGIRATGAGGKSMAIHARLVVAADGRFSTFVKQVGSKTLTARELSTFAYWGYFSGADRIPQAIHKRGRLGTAIFQTSDGTQMALAYGPNAWWDGFRKDAENNFFRLFAFCAPETAEALRGGKREEPFKACGTMPAFQRELCGPGWVLVGDAASFEDQVTAMGMTHAFRDAELLADCVYRGFSGEMTLEAALTAYARNRAEDHYGYFELVCRTAEMNPYTNQEVGFFHCIRHDQEQINQLLSQFGDTLPLTKGKAFTGVPDASLADVVGGFESRLPSYQANPFEISGPRGMEALAVEAAS